MSDPLAELLRERGDTEHEVLWGALMVCNDCPHRMIDHDWVEMRCLRCRCNQSHRGLSSHATDRLLALGRAIREADHE